MITIFENFNDELTKLLKNPEIGQYVLLRNNPELLTDSNNIYNMENNVGLIEDIIHGAYVSYDVFFDEKNTINNNLRVFAFRGNIITFGTKEEMEIKLQAKKFNI